MVSPIFKVFDAIPLIAGGTCSIMMGGIPLVVQVSFGDFQAAFAAHRLLGGVLYKVLSVPDPDTANRVMDGVRAKRV